MRSPPPLPMIHAFEAAARLGSFTKAARELGLSQPAVSRQITALEDATGVDLFDRRKGKVTLTPEGERYAHAVGEALQLISVATDQISRRGAQDSIVISALPSVAQRWLVPRLPSLRERVPGLQINVHTSYEHVDFVRDGIDIVLKFGLNDYPGGEGDFLMPERLFPACAQSMVTEGRAPEKVGELAKHTLLETFDPRWGQWLALAGAPEIDSQAPVRLREPSMVIQAALEGQGIGMVRQVLAQSDLDRGRLVRLFDLEIQHPHAYWIVTPKGIRDDRRIAAVRGWLHEQASLRKDAQAEA